MSLDNYWTRRIGRRSVVRGAALGGVGLAGAALIGCGSDDTGAGTPTTPGGGATATAVPSNGVTTPPETVTRGGVLRKHIAAEPPNFDMHANSTYAVNNAVSPVFNTLVQFDPAIRNESPASIIPDIAESWEVSNEGLTYTFSIVQNGVFHDGKPLTSDDVKATFDRIMDPPSGLVSPRQDQFGPVENIETPDDHTVVFNLSRPSASLLPIIATGWNVIYSSEDIGNDFDFRAATNGTGPFRLQEYLRGNRVVMTRHQDYHHDTYPYMDGVTIFIVPDNSTALTSFQSGELDLHRSLTPSDLESITRSLGDRVTMEGPQPSLGFLSVNYGAREPWTDERVRRAVTLSINRDESIAVVNQGIGYLGGYHLPGGDWAISEEQLRTVPGYDMMGDAARAEARQLLDAAGVPQGFETTMMVRRGSSYERAGLFLADQFTQVGIRATINVTETAAAYEALDSRAFDLAPWGHAYALDDPDALFAEFYLQNSPRNYSGVGSQEVDDLFDRQSAEMDVEARRELVNEMEMKALALYGKTIGSWSSKTEGYWNHVKDRVGHASHYNNQRFERVWLDV